jgi:hypothetical protein
MSAPVWRPSLGNLAIPLVPSINRFSPTCTSAMIEGSVHARFGIRSISKAWFNYTIAFSPPSSSVGLSADGLELNLSLGSAGIDSHGTAPGAMHRALQRLRYYYGVSLAESNHANFGNMMAFIRAALEDGKLLISEFDMWYRPNRREYGAIHTAHWIGIVGLNEELGILHAVDNLPFGKIDIEIGRYEACFDYLPTLTGRHFTLLECDREPGHHEPILRADELRADLRMSLANLTSTDPTLGLRGLRNGTQAIQTAARTLNRPFSVPNMWTFVNERHNLLTNLPHWREANLISGPLLVDLDANLREAFFGWFEAGAIIETCLKSNSTKDLEKLPDLLNQLVTLEENTVCLFASALTWLESGQ